MRAYFKSVFQQKINYKLLSLADFFENKIVDWQFLD
jgi:hypothetical protein